MPPAFVLSQDQTLKFIPDLRKSSCLLKADPMIRAAKRSHRCTNIRAALSRRPRIPSLFSTISNNNPRRGSDQKRPTPPRGRAYRPTSPPRQHPISSIDHGGRECQGSAAVIERNPVDPACPERVQQKFTRPRFRSAPRRAARRAFGAGGAPP